MCLCAAGDDVRGDALRLSDSILLLWSVEGFRRCRDFVGCDRTLLCSDTSVSVLPSLELDSLLPDTLPPPPASR